MTLLTEYLDQQQVTYRLLPHTKPTTNIEETARQRNITPEIMVKSILLRDMGNQYVLACVPGNQSVDPKKVRAILNSRRMTCASYSEIFNITGYNLGTVTPLQLKTKIPIVFDLLIKQVDEVTISSGSDMAGIALNSKDLIALCHPILANICRD